MLRDSVFFSVIMFTYKFKETIIMLEKLQEILQDIKAEQTTVINVKTLTNIADYIVICTGRSKRHSSAIAEHVKENIKKLIDFNPVIQGLESSEWIIVDLQDVVLHIMLDEIRNFYQLEKLWDKDLIISNQKN